MAALKANQRFLDFDLNRIWTEHYFSQSASSGEIAEMQELKALIEELCLNEHSKVYLIDLHTTSAPSIPFMVHKLNGSHHSFVEDVGVPYVSGLDGRLEGTLLAWMCEQGHCGLAFEAGQQFSNSSLIKHEAFVQLSMYYTGFFPEMPKEEIKRLRNLLDDELALSQKHFTLVDRYAIKDNEQFVMEKGYTNFQRIHKGQLLAKNQDGDILAPMDGNIFMPLYQTEGNDGFFIIQPKV